MQFSEADEVATSKERALLNLWQIVQQGERTGVIAMYERAAQNVGATVSETAAFIAAARRLKN